jgi:hypothetical protein
VESVPRSSGVMSIFYIILYTLPQALMLVDLKETAEGLVEIRGQKAFF